MSKHRSNNPIFALIMMTYAIHLPYANATEWRLNGNVKQDTGYDDNVRMQKQAQGSFEYLLTPQLSVARKEQDWDINANASYGLQQYTDIDGLDYSPQNYGAQSEYRTARTRWGLNASYADTLSRNNAVQDTGNFASASNQVKWAVSPSFSYLLTQRDSVTITAGYNKTAYSSSALSSSDGQSANMTWQRQWNERLTHNIGFAYTHYQFGSLGNSSTADSYSLTAMLAYKLTQLWSIQGSLGGRVTESLTESGQQALLQQISSGFLADLSFTYTGEQITSSLKLGRSLAPSSQGNLNEQTQLAWNAGYKLNKRWQAAIGTSYQMSKATSQNSLTNNSFNNRNNLTVTPNLNWLITPEWVAQLSYRYRQQDSLYLAESNMLMLTLTYNWQGFSISR